MREIQHVITSAHVAPFRLQRCLILLVLLCAFVFLASGCGNEQPANKEAGKPTSAADVVAQIQQLQSTFKWTDPTFMNMKHEEADAAVTDIQQNDYPAAIEALEKMRAEPRLNSEQDTVVRNVIDFLQRSSSGKAQR